MVQVGRRVPLITIHFEIHHHHRVRAWACVIIHDVLGHRNT